MQAISIHTSPRRPGGISYLHVQVISMHTSQSCLEAAEHANGARLCLPFGFILSASLAGRVKDELMRASSHNPPPFRWFKASAGAFAAGGHPLPRRPYSSHPGPRRGFFFWRLSQNGRHYRNVIFGAYNTRRMC